MAQHRRRFLSSAMSEDVRVIQLLRDQGPLPVLAWAMMTIHADDSGRLPGDPALLQARLFPGGGVDPVAVVAAVSSLIAIGLAISCDSGATVAIAPAYWGAWQTNVPIGRRMPLTADGPGAWPTTVQHKTAPISTKKHKTAPISTKKHTPVAPVIPATATDTAQAAADSLLAPAPAPDTARTLRIVGGDPARRGTVPSGFDEFWAEFPRHPSRPVSKSDAAKAWARQVQSDDEAASVMRGLRASVATKAWATAIRNTDITFIPHPATWLNGRRWEEIDDWADISLVTPEESDDWGECFQSVQ